MSSPNLEDRAEFADNPEDRCACVLLLDVSGSMAGNSIQMVNDAIKGFKDEVSRDRLTALRAEIAVVAFNHTINVVRDFVTVRDFDPPQLSASGGTKIAGAVNKALDMIAQRKKDYRANNIGYYRPLVVLLTDGYPQHDTPGEIAEATQRIAREEAERQVAFFFFGVEGADMAMLAQIATPQRPPLWIQDAEIDKIFQWLASSVSAISTSQPGERLTLPLPPGLTEY
jgi:uncharacterized protein YegL